MGTKKDSEETRLKILNAAGKLFADRGFNGVTVRDITNNSKTNLSALNYHFKSKEALYEEVIIFACKSIGIKDEQKNKLLGTEPETALYDYIKASLLKYKNLKESDWEMALIDREYSDPSQMFKEIAQNYLKPEAELLSQIVHKLVNKPQNEKNIQFSIVLLFGILSLLGSYDQFIDIIAPKLRREMYKKNWMAQKLFKLIIDASKSIELERK